MSIKINRNDPCPCGSGKKYKKCCGKNETVSITSLLESEIVELQSQIIQYAFYEFDGELEEDFDYRASDMVFEDEQERNFFKFVHASWFSLFQPFETEKTILDYFIEKQSKFIKRPKIKEVLNSWTQARPIAGRLISIDSDQMTVLDTLTNETIQIKLLEESEDQIPENSFIFALTVPYGNETILFQTFFDLEGAEQDDDIRFLQSDFKESEEYDNSIEFLQDHFFDLVYDIQFAETDYSPEAYEWANLAHKEVAVLYESEQKKMGAPEELIGVGVGLWKEFCDQTSKRVQKPAIYASALEFLIMNIDAFGKITKKEVAERYGVSPASLSKAVNDMEAVIGDKISKLHGAMVEDIIEALKQIEKRNSDKG